MQNKKMFSVSFIQNFRRWMDRSGAALLEVIVAMGIVTLVMTTIVSLVTVSLKSAALSQSKNLGTKYAQEGLESLRQMRNIAGWDTFLTTLQADGTTIHYCLPTVPTSVTELAALPNAACSASQFVDAKNRFQRQADITITTQGARTSVATTVTVTWDDSGVQKSAVVSQQFEEYNVADAPAPVIYSPVPYGYNNTGWNYRKLITYTNSSASTFANYQMLLTFDTASLISQGKMRSDCADIRITHSNGTTNEPYWIVPGTCNTSATKIWVKVLSLANPTQTNYIYYGYLNATAPSYTPTNVFTRTIPNMIAAFDFDEASYNGTTNEVADMSGNANNGTSYNGANTVAGKFGGRAVSFDGVNDYITVPRSASLEQPTSAISISAWFYWSAVPGAWSKILQKGIPGGVSPWSTYEVLHNSSNGFINFTATVNGVQYWSGNGSVVSLNTWHHMLGTWSNTSNQVRLYYDGVLQGTGATTPAGGTLTYYNSPLRFGAAAYDYFGNFMLGTVDNVKIFKSELSSTDALYLANSQEVESLSYPGNDYLATYDTRVAFSAYGSETSGLWTGL